MTDKEREVNFHYCSKCGNVNDFAYNDNKILWVQCEKCGNEDYYNGTN